MLPVVKEDFSFVISGFDESKAFLQRHHVSTLFIPVCAADDSYIHSRSCHRFRTFWNLEFNLTNKDRR